MRKVYLNMSQNYKYETIKNCYFKRLSKQGAATRLGLSIRQINRLLNIYQTKGKAGFIHGNTGKTSTRKVDFKTQQTIIKLYQSKYDNSNCKHFTELLVEHEGITISETYVRALLHDNNIYPPRTWKRTKKRVLIKQKSLLSNVSDSTIDNNLILEVPVATLHPSKSKKKYFGEEVQMDASNHIWFGNGKSHLHAAIDNATGNILALYFDKQETLNGYYNLYLQILSKYGIPYEFSTDRRTIFEYRKKASSIENDTFTQFAYACKHFGTNIKTSSVPQAKGQIERLFGTLQSRLITELKIRDINDIDSANKFLTEFIEQYNSKFALQINYTTSVFEKVTNQEDIYNVLCVRSPSIINSGSCINFQNKVYYPAIDNERKYFDFRTKALVFKTLDNKLYVTIGNEIYNLIELPKNLKVSKDFDFKARIKRKKKVYRPKMDHPWRQYSFEKFALKQKHLHNEDITQMYQED